MVRGGKLAMLAAIGCIAIVPAGCGGSSDSDESAASDESTAAATVADSEASDSSTGESSGSSGTSGDERAKDDTADGSTELSPEERQGDTALVEQVVRDLIEGMNTQDESVCTRLFDRHLVDPSKRDEEEATCRQTIANHPGGVELVEFESVRFRQSASGRESLVNVVVRQGKQPPSRLGFHLMKMAEVYKIDRGVPTD